MHPYHQNDCFYEYFHSNYVGVALRCNCPIKWEKGDITLYDYLY